MDLILILALIVTIILIIVTMIVALTFGATRVKEVNKANIQSIQDATQWRKEMLQTQKQLLEEMRLINNNNNKFENKK